MKNKAFSFLILLLCIACSTIRQSDENSDRPRDNDREINTLELSDKIPSVFKDYISQIQYASLGTYEPEISTRWEDFETYWSCNPYGAEHLVGEKVERNNMYKQNNFSIYWTAEALFNTYQITEDEKYLEYGQRTLDELLMTQAAWQPPYNTLGGFGMMNTDGEWNDARQSLFSELIVRYGKELENEQYIQRDLAALRASFVMMYAPENPTNQKTMGEKIVLFW